MTSICCEQRYPYAASILSYAQYDFLNESLNNLTTAPSYLVVKVKSPSYEGEAVTFNSYLMSYYKIAKNKSLKFKKNKILTGTMGKLR
jgi:hypothetical protein